MIMIVIKTIINLFVFFLNENENDNENENENKKYLISWLL